MSQHQPGTNPRPAPTVEPPEPDGLASALERNISALAEQRRRTAESASPQDRFAETITRFVGSMRFVFLHLAMFGGWTIANLFPFAGFKPFDPELLTLATFASVEAIFLSTFVLISQNRAALVADRRADLNLQISLLSEHEVTHLIELVVKIAGKLGVEEAGNPELDELTRNVAPEAVLERLEETSAADGQGRG